MDMKLTCDVCGGALWMEDGGQVATCEYCGTKYSIGRLREKIQEIKGTVKIEGSVNARQTGTNEDVEQWRSLVKKYMASFDYENAAKIVSKILEALPSDKEAGEIYDQLQDAKYLEIKNGILVKYHGKAQKVVIPYGVTEIGDYAFGTKREEGGIEPNTIFREITIPDSVTSIGDYAFAYCLGLTSITLPDGLTSIGGHAFHGCWHLTSIKIPDSVTSIGNSAFFQCPGLTSITIPNSVTSIGNSAFSGCTGLTSVTIPDSVTSIGKKAFYYCTGLTSITIGNNVSNIAFDAFEKCENLRSYYISNLTAWVGLSFKYPSWQNHLFINGTKVTKLVIPSGVTSINSMAFQGFADIISVTIPNSVTSIGNSAFKSCTDLTSITIPNSVKTIGSQAFYGCTGLTDITVPDTVSQIENQAFYSCDHLQNVRIPSRFESTLPESYQQRLNQQRVQTLRYTRRSQGVCQYCGGRFEGVFKKTCSECGRAKDY